MAALDTFSSNDNYSAQVNQLLNISEQNLLATANEMWANLSSLCQSLNASIECFFNLFANMMKTNLTSLNYGNNFLMIYDEWIDESREHLKEFCSRKDFKSTYFKEKIAEINSNLHKKFENIENIFLATTSATTTINLCEIKSEEFQIVSEEQPQKEIALSTVEWYDLGDIDLKSLNHEVRKVLVNKSHIIPPKDYKFPVTIQNNREKTERRVSHAILERYKPWLVFSMKMQGLYCKYCATIHNGEQFKNYQFKSHKLSDFIREPCCKFTDLTGSKGKLSRHEASAAHKYSSLLYNNILEESKLEYEYYNVRKDAMCTTNQLNEECLITIISLMKKMTKQNFEFRCHRDCSNTEIDINNSEEGNWLEMLIFATTINKNFKNFIENVSANAGYSSLLTMRKYQQILANLVKIQLINEIQEANIYSIIFNETCDFSGENILSLAIRYVSENGIKECFLGIFNIHHECLQFMGKEPKITGEILGKIILKTCLQLNLNLENCVSVGTDGAGVCSSKEISAIKYIKDNLSGCTHSYCISNFINLCVCNVTNLSKVELVIDMINKIGSFFNFAKRQNVLMKHFPATDKRKLKQCSETRLIERFEAIILFKIKLKYIFNALIEIENWDDPLTSAKAFKYRSTIENLEFISSLVFISDIMKFLEPLAMKLQTITIDLQSVLSEAKGYSLGLKERIEGEDSMKLFNSLIEESTNIYNDLFAPDAIYKDKCPDFETTKNYFESYKSITEKIISNLESHLTEREFVSSKLCLFHPQFIHDITESEIDDIVRKFHCQISSTGYESTLFGVKQEIKHFKMYFVDNNQHISFTNLFIGTVNQYKLLSGLFKLLVTITETDSTSEGLISKLQLMKDVLKNSFYDKNLSNEAMISINRDIDISEKWILEEYIKEDNMMVIG